jgi:hypothetical protein
MPQNPQKTKGEILLELESIKGLLLEEDDIPILQEVDHHHHPELLKEDNKELPKKPAQPGGTQTSIFDELEDIPIITDLVAVDSQTHNQSMPKALGENPFLPQHIRERLHGNNPPPIFDFDLTQKSNNNLKPKSHIENRHDLVNDLVKRYLPQIEQELRLKLLAMTEDELKKL